MILAWLAGCFPQTYDGQCNRVLVRLCDHQLECGLTPSHNKCMDNLRDIYVCDEGKDLELYETCVQEVLKADCREILPDQCGRVLCDATEGCVTIPHCNPETQTDCTGTTTCGTGDTGCSTTYPTP